MLRDRFDKYKYETNQKKIQMILADAETEFENKKHPFPYVGKRFNAKASFLLGLPLRYTWTKFMMFMTLYSFIQSLCWINNYYNLYSQFTQS